MLWNHRPSGAFGLSSVDTVVVESTEPSEYDVESERGAVVKRECWDIDLATYTDLIQSAV